MSIYILTPELFIKQKAQQLVYFINQLMNQKIAFKEVHIVTWDILEEWGKLDIQEEEQINDFERVFWYLFFIIQFEAECDLVNNKHLRLRIDRCCNYLKDPNLAVPAGCVGIRP